MSAMHEPKGRMHFSGATGPARNPTFGYAWKHLREPMQYVAQERAWAMQRMDAIERERPYEVRR